MDCLKGKVAIADRRSVGFRARDGVSFRPKRARKWVVADLNGEGAKAVASKIGESAWRRRRRLVARADTEAMVKAATDNFGRLDIMINMPATRTERPDGRR